MLFNNRFSQSVLNIFKSQRRRFAGLPLHQALHIKRSIIILNIVMLVIVVGLNAKVSGMVNKQTASINAQITLNNNQVQATDQFKKKYTRPIAAQVFLTDDRLIDVKAQTISMPFVISMKYPESWYPNPKSSPSVGLDNGIINNSTIQFREVKDGMVELIVNYQTTINTAYSSLMYPLDKQFVWLNISTVADNESDTNLPYLVIDEFHRNTNLYKNRNYRMIQHGFLNIAKSTEIQIGANKKVFTDMTNMNYLIYTHKNVLSYLKTTQYIIFAVFIAIFALLINQKNGTAISGRISVIGSSIFSMSANVFQINSLVNQSSGIILIDVLSFFAGSVILLCFLITIQTIKISDSFSFEASKLYDLFAFRTMLCYIILFFVMVYIQA